METKTFDELIGDAEFMGEVACVTEHGLTVHRRSNQPSSRWRQRHTRRPNPAKAGLSREEWPSPDGGILSGGNR